MTDSKHKFVELTLYYLAGFGDVTHFVRAFTREKGISPGKYRNEVLHDRKKTS